MFPVLSVTGPTAMNRQAKKVQKRVARAIEKKQKKGIDCVVLCALLSLQAERVCKKRLGRV